MALSTGITPDGARDQTRAAACKARALPAVQSPPAPKCVYLLTPWPRLAFGLVQSDPVLACAALRADCMAL